MVPFALAGQTTAEVVVSHYGAGQVYPPFSVPVASTAPAIFTESQNGGGQGSFIHYPSNSHNSADNPAPAGSAVTFFATGEGVWDDTIQDGSVSVGVRHFVTKAVSLTVGSQPARILYAGAVPYQAGRLQINAILPDGISSGPQPVVLKIGEADNAQQRVTIEIK